MIFIEFRFSPVFKYCVAGLLLLSGFSIAQTRSSVGQFSVSITLNGVAPIVAGAPPPPTAGSCVTRALFNQMGAVIRVTCVDNPFVDIAPSIDAQFPGTFGNTFRYPLHSSPSSFNLLNATDFSFNEVSRLRRNGSGNNFNSPASTVTDLSIYRTEPQATMDAQGELDITNMVISF